MKKLFANGNWFLWFFVALLSGIGYLMYEREQQMRATIKKLNAEGMSCTIGREQTGPSHTRSKCYVCIDADRNIRIVTNSGHAITNPRHCAAVIDR